MSNEDKLSARRLSLLGDRPGSYAIARHVRMSPTKVRRVIDLVRGMPVNDALVTLRFAPQAASDPVYKVVASAIANAEHTEALEADNLYISKAFVDEGTTLKRIRPRAKGSASQILKRGSHITVVVEPLVADDVVETPKPRRSGRDTAAEVLVEDLAVDAEIETDDAAAAIEAEAEAKPKAKKAAAKSDAKADDAKADGESKPKAASKAKSKKADDDQADDTDEKEA